MLVLGAMQRREILELLREHHRSAYGWAVHCCRGDRWDAEGVLHDVYVQVLEGKTEFRGEAQPRTWLFALIRNTAWQRRRRLLRRLRLLGARLLGASEPTRQPPPDEAYTRGERRRQIESLLARLPARQQEVLHLVFYQELSLREAAQLMGISIGAARTHYHRGKTTLRREIEESGLDYGRSWQPSDSSVV